MTRFRRGDRVVHRRGIVDPPIVGTVTKIYVVNLAGRRVNVYVQWDGQVGPHPHSYSPDSLWHHARLATLAEALAWLGAPGE